MNKSCFFFKSLKIHLRKGLSKMAKYLFTKNFFCFVKQNFCYSDIYMSFTWITWFTFPILEVLILELISLTRKNFMCFFQHFSQKCFHLQKHIILQNIIPMYSSLKKGENCAMSLEDVVWGYLSCFN